MFTTVIRHGLMITLLAGTSLSFSGGAHAQDAVSQTNRPPSRSRLQPDVTPYNPFALSDLALTGSLLYSSSMVNPQSLLELKWKLQYALDTKNVPVALEYASVSLIGSPEEELQLLRSKAVALVKLHRIPDAIATFKYILVLEPHDVAVMYNIAELLLVSGQVDEYQSFALRHKEQLDRAYDGTLAKYFSVLAAYQTEDEEQMRAMTTRLLASLPSRQEPLLGDWTFDDLLTSLAQERYSRKKVMLMSFILVLTGELGRDEAIKKINDL